MTFDSSKDVFGEDIEPVVSSTKKVSDDKKPKSKEFKFDIFKLLSDIDTGNLHLWETFTPEEQKGISPYTVPVWMTGTDDKRQIILINEFVNPYIFEFSDHKQLLLKLMVVCSSKVRRHYQWLAPKKKGGPSKISLQVIQDYFGYSARIAKQQISLLSADAIYSMAEQLGYQKEELAKLKKELKD